MCGYTGARIFLCVLLIVGGLVGGGLLGVAIYGQVYELAHDRHFLDQFFEKEQGQTLEKELKSRILLYFQVVTGFSIGLGACLFITAIWGLVGAYKHFKSVNRYGTKKSNFGGFVFFILIVLFASGLAAAFMLYVGIDGKIEGSANGPTQSPDYKFNWKVVDLRKSASQIYNDLVEFCWTTRFYNPQSPTDSENLVTNTLFLSGGVMCAVVVLAMLWLIVGCCLSCGHPAGYVESTYVSTEKQKYDDWIYNDRRRSAYS